MNTKQCYKCKTTFLKKEAWKYFHKHNSTKDGLHSFCKKCKSKYEKTRARILYQKNYQKLRGNKKEARLKAQREYSGRAYKCAVISCKERHADLHHVDYNRPFEVVPLCKKHHKLWHNCVGR